MANRMRIFCEVLQNLGDNETRVTRLLDAILNEVAGVAHLGVADIQRVLDGYSRAKESLVKAALGIKPSAGEAPSVETPPTSEGHSRGRFRR